jgi:hypothetical protein
MRLKRSTLPLVWCRYGLVRSGFGQDSGKSAGTVTGAVVGQHPLDFTPRAANAAMALRISTDAASLVSSGRISE